MIPYQDCEHRYLTVFPGSGGWSCAKCKVPVLSMMLPIPLPLIAQAIEAVVERSMKKGDDEVRDAAQNQ